MPQPRQVTATAEELIRVYIDAWQAIVAEQERILADPRRTGRRRRLNELRVSVERELAKLDVPTRGWLRTRLPQVYAAGAESTLTVLGGEALTWTSLHTSAVQRLATDTFTDLLRATEFVREDTKRFIRDAAKAASERTLTTGRTAQGSARTLSGAMRGRGIAAVIYKDGSRHGLAEYAETVVRTKTAVAYNEGTVNTAVERGFTVFEIFDGPGCGLEAHAVGPEANGMIVNADTAMAWPIAHPRCVHPDTLVRAVGSLKTGYRAWYSGTVISVRTLGGARVTVTPDHPVLTDQGWIPAKLLDQGLKLVRCTGERQVSVLPGDRDLEQGPARIEDVFDALWAACPGGRSVASANDLHGDGGGIDGEVDVVDAHGLLPPMGDSAAIQFGSEPVLVGAGPQHAGLPSGRPGQTLSVGVGVPASRLPARLHVPEVAVLVTDGDPTFPEPLRDRVPVTSERAGDVLSGLSGEVSLDDVVDVQRETWCGHVYDLETSASAYIANGIVVHNCQRAFAARPDLPQAGARPTAAPSFASTAAPVARSPRAARTPRSPRQPRQRRTARA